MRGYDDLGDYHSITRHAGGRRINLEDPARWLFLLKPTATLPHKGGRKFDTDSREYAMLSRWIAEGAAGPQSGEPTIARLEIQPAQSTLALHGGQPLKVRAHFSDGRADDVTAWAKYSSANETVCNVDEAGAVSVVGFGEGAVTAWFLQKIAVATVTVPYPNRLNPETFVNAARVNFIDELVLEKLEVAEPAAVAAVHRRRIHPSRVPRHHRRAPHRPRRPARSSPTAARKNATDSSSSCWAGRSSSTTGLTSGPISCWSVQRNSSPRRCGAIYHWIPHNVAANTPWDEFVRDIVTATGSTLENGAANFFVLHEDPRLMAETTTQAFLGMSVNCAQVPQPPAWRSGPTSQYFAFANLFARVRLKAANANEGDHVVFAVGEGDLVQPLTGRPLAPAPLDGIAARPRLPRMTAALRSRTGWSRRRIPCSHAPSSTGSGQIFSDAGLVEAGR